MEGGVPSAWTLTPGSRHDGVIIILGGTSMPRKVSTEYAKVVSDLARKVEEAGELQRKMQALLVEFVRLAKQVASVTGDDVVIRDGRKGRPPYKERTCSVRGCTYPLSAKGFCAIHYNRKQYRMLKRGSA